jgi:hypothetical protein
VGQPEAAIRIPLRAATLRAGGATLFVVQGDRAKRLTVPVLGERGGSLLLQPKIAAGTPVVIEGRALLEDNDRVQTKEQAAGAQQ